MDKQPNNKSTPENPVGRFMVASGAVVELNNSRKILVIQRAKILDWQPNEWEIVYGRIDQYEDNKTGLLREVNEEIGLNDLQIVDVINVWHIFRGTKNIAQNELIGVTYWCKTNSSEIKLSKEHQDYKWVTPEEALELINMPRIKDDIYKFIQKRSI